MSRPEAVKANFQWPHAALILVGSTFVIACAYIAIVSAKESGAREAKLIMINSACGDSGGRVAAGWEEVCAKNLGPDDIEVTRTVIQGE